LSKKKFTDGLESLFLDAAGDPFEKDSPLLVDSDNQKDPETSKPSSNKGSKGKSFASDLQSYLEDTVMESIQEEVDKRRQEDPKKELKKARSRKRMPKPMGGLDALIRRTIENSEIEVNYHVRKRVTFTFEKDKLEKLKKIAKTERAYLKDIIGKIVAEYIDKYEEEKGL
jgi:hypothetical protein